MSFEGLLAFFGIALAIAAIADPVQRHSMTLFVPIWVFVGGLLLSLALILIQHVLIVCCPEYQGALLSLRAASFLLPVAAALWCGYSWHEAKLTAKNRPDFETLLKSALRESKFDEVERIVTRNRDRLRGLQVILAAV